MARLRSALTARVFAALAVLSSLALPGCGGGGGDEGPVYPSCRDVPQVLAFDEVAPFGASAREVLAPVLGTNTAPLLWAQRALIDVGPEQGMSGVELTATYRDAPVTWVTYELVPGDVPTELGCREPQLKVDVDIELSSSGGALDEQFSTTLTASEPGIVTLFHRPALEDLDGTLTVAATMAGHSVPNVGLSVEWNRLGFSGVLSADVDTMRPEPLRYSIVTIADWQDWVAPGGAGAR